MKIDIRNLCVTTGSFLALFCGLVLQSACAQGPTDEKQLKEFLIGGFNTSRDSLVSGECRIVMTTSANSVPTKYHLLFDIAAGTWRFDSIDDDLHSKFIQTAEFSYLYIVDGGNVEKGNPIPERDRTPIFPFDPRLVGMTHSGYISLRLSYDAFKLDLPRRLCASLKQTGDGEYNAVFTKPDLDEGVEAGKLIYEYEIRANRGFTPDQVVESYLPTGETTPEKMEQVNTTWEQHGDVWVPLVAQYKDLREEGDLKLAFEWLSVNEPIPPARFDFHDFDLPDGTIIVDMRLGGEGIIIETIGASPKSTPTKTALPD